LDKEFKNFLDKSKINMLKVGTKSFHDYDMENAELGKATLGKPKFPVMF